MKVRALVFLACMAASVLWSPLLSAERRPYSGIVVFGTSLSDSGNAFALRGASSTPPDYMLDPLLVPGAPYARGGHHFSNGATWVEQLARSFGLAGSVRPAFGSRSLLASNYAVGGARAHEDGKNYNLLEQVQAFLGDVSGHAPSDALYVIEMGGNDIRDAILAYQTGGLTAAQAILEEAIANIAQSIQLLYAAGARDFLVWLPPNVALTPAVRFLDQISPGAAQLASILTAVFNAGLSGVLTQLAALPGVTITPFDASALLTAIVADPQAYGLSDATAACVTPSVPPFSCGRPDEYLFWDGIHPSRAGHAITAATVAMLLGQ